MYGINENRSCFIRYDTTNSLMLFINDCKWLSLRETCQYSDLFWIAFSLIRTEYGEIITRNTDTFYLVFMKFLFFPMRCSFQLISDWWVTKQRTNVYPWVAIQIITDIYLHISTPLRGSTRTKSVWLISFKGCIHTWPGPYMSKGFKKLCK